MIILTPRTTEADWLCLVKHLREESEQTLQQTADRAGQSLQTTHKREKHGYGFKVLLNIASHVDACGWQLCVRRKRSGIKPRPRIAGRR